MRATPALAGILALLLLLGGCAGQQEGIVSPPPAGDAAATVNGLPIPMALYQAQLEVAIAGFAQPGLDASSPDVQAALRRQVLEMLIDQALVDQAAARMGTTVDDAELAAEVERIRNESGGDFAAWLHANGHNEETFRAQLRSDLLGAAVREQVVKEVAATAEQVHLRQIVVEGEEQALALVQQLRQDPAALAGLATAHSIDEGSRAAGGNLGFVPRGILPPAVEQAAFALTPSEVSEPVQSAMGWHVLRLEAREPARDIPPELLNTLRHQAFMRWLDVERSQATIERFVE